VLQPTRLSFTGAALKAHDRQQKVGADKPQPVQKISLKPVKEAAKQPLAAKVQPKKRILSERSTTSVQGGGDVKRSKKDTVQNAPTLPSVEVQQMIDIADELADLFEDHDDASDMLAPLPAG